MAALLRQFARSVMDLAIALAVSHDVFAQQRPASGHAIIPVIGTVKAISGNSISVSSGAQLLTFSADAETEIWKGKTFHDLSPVQVGDDLWARCHRDPSGKLVAESVWLNIVNFFGVITRVDGGDRFEMLTNPNADPQSAYVKKKMIVQVDSATLFNDSAKEDLKTGREVQMVGLDLKDGMIRAARLTVYEGKRPVRMPNGTVLPVTGPPK